VNVLGLVQNKIIHLRIQISINGLFSDESPDTPSSIVAFKRRKIMAMMKSEP